VQLTAR